MTDKIKIDMLDLFSTDRESEEAGVWIYLDEAEQTGFKIRALGAKAVLDLREELTKKYQSLIRAGGKLPDEKVEEINLKVIAGGVLADWKGIIVGGEEIPYSAEAAYTVLSNPKLGKMSAFIAQHSMDAQNYRDDAREDAAKKLTAALEFTLSQKHGGSGRVKSAARAPNAESPDDWLARIKAQNSGPPPSADDEFDLNAEPKGIEPYPDLLWVWDGFWRLSNKRPNGMSGPMRIPTSEIEAFTRIRRWDYAKSNEFLFYVDMMDEVYMAHVAKVLEEQERQRETAANKPPIHNKRGRR
ncbi:tail assembly chaperone [Caulobacter virus Karma]|uniref:Pre-tape measure chaperone protein n=6 Tax=Viruses TaxID=10239 RepID=K4JPK7_9CAUD|nr:tail assembly chaperone [Caulobacter phage phiCbK]YP_006988772.1 tail assembly chaperone [Caulobacter virus Magneto]YP_006989474.1 tail assembly chaperone [Caulobacter virus Karma]YP_006989822.1 tail assembly chaperone [Caulobacter phage CcrSwift]ARB14309.1 hypothetical protein [Caulobacter phage Ccr5]ARB15009.1 putative pre-tape measure chaperone protein [Caulobacter phage Ccr32]ARB15340.1 putative pre-tape measure chaperone protein [Caulobacter phage Ccr34]AFU86926.1 putative pre-tape m